MNTTDPTRPDIQVGCELIMRYGPFQCTATVVARDSHGGLVIAPNDDAKLVGYSKTQTAPNGRVLTTDLTHDYIGSAHLHALEVATRE